MGVLAAQQMFAYMQAQLALPQQQQAGGGGAGSASLLGSDAASTSYATVHPTDVNTLASINASRAVAPLFQRRIPALLQHGSPAACTFVCVFNFFCVFHVLVSLQSDALS